MPRKHFTAAQRKLIAAAALVVFLAFSILVGYFIGRPMLAFVKTPDRFRAWVDAHGISGRLIFLGMVVLQMLVALIPGEPLELGAGYAFGALEGTLLCLIGMALGTLLVWGFVRRFGLRLVEVFFPPEKIASLRFLQNERRFEDAVFVIMLLPGTPKDLLCYFIPLTRMPLSHWLFIATIARIPSVITSTISGGALGEQNYPLAASALAITALLSLAGLALYRKFMQKRN